MTLTIFLTVIVTQIINLKATANVGPPVEFSITEELPLGYLVGNLKDAFLKLNSNKDIDDDNLRFLLLSEHKKFLNVDEYTGVLTVGSRIDRDTLCHDEQVSTCCKDSSLKCRLNLDVSVKGGLFIVMKAYVYINDINDNPPKWDDSSITLTAIEEEPKQNLTIPAARDPDHDINGSLTYVLKDDFDGTFKIVQPKPTDRSVTIQVLKKLDRETKTSYSMVLLAKDGGRYANPGLTGTLTLTISVKDINDHAPVFDKSLYEREMAENSKDGEFVLRVHASDQDEHKNSKIVYKIDESNFNYQNSIFRIDRNTGNIELIGRLDYETKKRHDFKVIARDSDHNPKQSTAEVVIKVKDVNDCRPQITVRDLSFNRLTGEISVVENGPAEQNIALVSVTDEDSGLAGSVECLLESSDYRSMEPFFKLKSLSGKTSSSSGQYLALMTTAKFDREEQNLYRLVIKCVDKGISPLSSQKSLTVKIIDENDNAPVFRPTSYTFYVKESSLENHLVGTVYASDKDDTQTNQIQFELVTVSQKSNFSFRNGQQKSILSRRDIDRYFHIDSHDGRILLRNKLDREDMAQMNFAVLARDGPAGRNGTKSSVANVVVVVTDVNDNQPQFNDSVYHFALKENVGPGFVVGNISAYDLDENENSRLQFKIEKSLDYNLPFMIHKIGTSSNTAKIITSQTIDRERMPHKTGTNQYVFKVTVTDDGQSQLSNSVKVIVDVLDVNDRAPEWVFPSRVNMAVNASRYSTTGQNVAIIKAIDQDSGNNAEIIYSIISGNTKDLFVLDPQDGKLKFRREVESSDQRVFNLVLRASDNPGGLPNETLSNTTVLKVTLIDLPDVNGGRGLSNNELGSSGGRSLTIIILLIGSTGVVAFILIMVIILARVVVYRRNRSMKKGSQMRRGPSTMSRLSSAGNPYPPETVFSTTQTRSQSGHTLSDVNKHEMVYYSAEELDRDVGMSRDPSSHMMTQSDLTSPTTLGREDGRLVRGKVSSIEGICDAGGRGGWLATTRTSGNAAGAYDTTQYNQLNLPEYTKLARIRNDMLDHYYDFVRHNQPTEQGIDENGLCPPSNNNHQQPLINVSTLHRRSLSNLEKKALLNASNKEASQTLNWRHLREPNPTQRELSEMPPLLSAQNDDSCFEENEIKKLTKEETMDRNATLANYRLKSKHSPYQASFV